MTARRSRTFPICRLGSEDAHKLADIFDEVASTARSEDNPVFRFETEAGTYTYDKFTAQSRRWSQREVTAIEMVAKNDQVWARLYLDLEEGPVIVTEQGKPPAAVRSRLEVEGDEEAAFQVWDQILAIVAFRSSAVARLMNNGLASLLALILLAAVIGLPVYTATNWPGPRPVPWSYTIALIAMALLGLLAWLVFVSWQVALWSRNQIEGWGRFEKRRNAIRWWTGTIVAGLVVWAITLVVQGVVPH